MWAEEGEGQTNQGGEMFAGPSSVPSQIVEDHEPGGTLFRSTFLRRKLRPYYAWKDRLQERHGLQLGGDYTVLYQRLSESLGERDAVGGIARVFGEWQLVNRGCPNGGSLVFKGENRYAMTDVAPQNLGFEAGYVGVTGPPFSDIRWALTNFYWRQRFADDRVSVIAGVIDATDFLDVYGLINPWTSFQNLAFLTNPTIATPNQGLGIAASAMLTDNLYAIAGLGDANGDPTGEPFESFFGDAEFFKHVELGWTRSKDRFFLDNVHVMAWHADRRRSAGVEESWGFAFSGAFYLCDRWMPFLRGGWSTGNAPVWDRSVSAGVGHFMKKRGDLAALAVSWGRPTGTDDEQWTTELFYRFQLMQSMALTPSVQLLVNPAANADADVVALFGLRWRVTF